MSVSINIPQELYDQARTIADARHVPVEQVFAAAFADQFAAWPRLQERETRGDRQKFLAVLESVPDVEPEEYDSV